jgi:hypothetical protein
LKMVFSSKNLIKIHQGQKVLFVCDVKSQQIKISAAVRVIEQLTKIL